MFDPPHGTILKQECQLNPGSKCVFECKQGFEMNMQGGNDLYVTLKCQHNGEWLKNDLQCEGTIYR